MSGALRKLNILDFSTLLPGPFATGLLADLGANVLRILSRSRPDLVTLMKPAIPDGNMSASEAWLGRNKRSMFLNLKHPEAKNVVHALLKTYDIVMEQFRPKVMNRLGFGYADLNAVNPRVIYCSLTGYGQTGPLSPKAGHDINYLSRSGLISYSGRRGGLPGNSGMQIADVGSGSLYAVIGILAAAVERESTGKGHHVDIAMLDGVMSFHAMRGANFLVDAMLPEPEDDLLNGGSFYDFYETSDGKYLSVGSLEPPFFKALCEAVGWKDRAAGGVLPQTPTEKEDLRAVFKSRPKDFWLEVFASRDACVEPVMTLQETLTDDHLTQRKMFVPVDLPESGKRVTQIACPVKFADVTEERRAVAWPTGYHTEEVMRGLGYRDDDLAALKKSGLFD